MTSVMRFLPSPAHSLEFRLDADNLIEAFVFDVTETNDTKMLFDEKYHAWRYNGKDVFEGDSWETNPKGEHFFEELVEGDDGYTENYQSIGHSPYGRAGDAIAIDGKVYDITRTDIEENYNKHGFCVGWIWVLYVNKRSADDIIKTDESYYSYL